MPYILSDSKINNRLSQSATLEEIEAYTEMVRQGVISCALPTCPNCETSSDFFKRHDTRERKFNAITGQIVIVIISLLVRWKCPGCNVTKTDYPGFALPYKRFTLPTILAFSGQYVENHDATYRGLVNTYPLEYQPRSDSEMESPAMMEHSTIHRWITTLGSYSCIVNTATDLILQKEPASPLCHDLASLKIPSKKYRSLLRKQLLLFCFRLVTLETVFHSVFHVSIFPQLATLYGYS
jgi:hypothetical protein